MIVNEICDVEVVNKYVDVLQLVFCGGEANEYNLVFLT